MVRQQISATIDGKGYVFRAGFWVEVRDTQMPQAIKDSAQYSRPVGAGTRCVAI